MATAPAKLILCGEHAVVYGRPAIALPLADIRATATVTSNPAVNGPMINAPDLGGRWSIAERPDEPLSGLVKTLIERFGISPQIEITIRSAIPIASGWEVVRRLPLQLCESYWPCEGRHSRQR